MTSRPSVYEGLRAVNTQKIFLFFFKKNFFHYKKYNGKEPSDRMGGFPFQKINFHANFFFQLFKNHAKSQIPEIKNRANFLRYLSLRKYRF